MDGATTADRNRLVRSTVKAGIDALLRPLGHRLTPIHPVTDADVVPTRWDVAATLAALSRCGLTTRRCVDVGAHLGWWTYRVMRRWPDAEVLMVDPQADLLDEVAARFGPNPRLHYRAVGAGPVDTTAMFHHHERDDSSSFTPASADRIRAAEQIEVLRIDRLVRETFGAVVPDLLKLDCEGWDLEVLEGAGALLGRIPAIFLEVGVTNPRFTNTVSAAIERLATAGYRLFDVGDGARTPEGALWNAELCFVLERSPIWATASTWEEVV